MSWTPGEGVDTSIGLGVGYKEPVDLAVNRESGLAYLVLGNHVAEIRLEPGHLKTIRDQLPGVLADLGVLDAANERAAEAGSRAVELRDYLLDQAGAADAAGAHERAGELRGTADKLTAAVKGLGNALAAVEDAALVADQAAEDAKRLLDDRVAEEQAAQPDPAEEQRTNGHPVDAA